MSGVGRVEFLLGLLVVLAAPGPSVLFLVARTLRHGRTAGLLAVLGLEAGLSLHVGVAAAGLSAALAASPPTLDMLRVAGACYLGWLGLRELHPPARPGPPREDDAATGGRCWRHVRDAAAVDVLNPQTALFVLAFLPRFVDTGRGTAGGQVLALGVVVVAVATLCDVAWVLLAASGRRWAAPGRWDGPRWRGVTAATYLTLAVLALLR